MCVSARSVYLCVCVNAHLFTCLNHLHVRVRWVADFLSSRLSLWSARVGLLESFRSSPKEVERDLLKRGDAL